MRIVMLSPISPLGDFYLLSININGEDPQLRMKNVRAHANQVIADPYNTMHIQMGWKIMPKSFTPIAVLEFHGSGIFIYQIKINYYFYDKKLVKSNEKFGSFENTIRLLNKLYQSFTKSTQNISGARST